jgi:hypothetical protein
MSKTREIYFEENEQRVRWTQSSSSGFKYDYKYVGSASEAEFDLLMEFLWFLYEDRKISYKDFKETYDELRNFCDQLKGLVD